MSTINYDLTKIKAIIFDVDGVLSRSVTPLSPDGTPSRTVNTKDGYAIQLAVKKGIRVAIITGAYSEAIRLRFEMLGVKDIYLRSHNKIADYEDFMLMNLLKDEEVIYAGDDLPDYEVMSKVGLPVAPADAAVEIKAIAKYISHAKGGEGVGRDLIEQTLKAKGLWASDKEAFGW